MMHIRLAIGRFETAVVPVTTTAPRAFDGFGTIELRRGYPVVAGVEIPGDGARLVLVRAEHLKWQTMRYSSGAYAVDQNPEEDDSGIGEHSITAALFEILEGREAQ